MIDETLDYMLGSHIFYDPDFQSNNFNFSYCNDQLFAYKVVKIKRFFFNKEENDHRYGVRGEKRERFIAEIMVFC